MAKTVVDLSSYRLAVRVWAPAVTLDGRRPRLSRLSSRRTGQPGFFIVVFLVFLLLRDDALPRHGDVERNPGPATSPDSVAGSNWNLNLNPVDDNIRSRVPRRHADLALRCGTRSSTSANGMKLLHFNARSLLSKRSELLHLCSTTSPHCCCYRDMAGQSST